MTREDIKVVVGAMDRANVPAEDIIRISDEMERMVEDKEPLEPPILCPVCGWKFIVDEYDGKIMLHCPNCGKVMKVKKWK